MDGNCRAHGGYRLYRGYIGYIGVLIRHANFLESFGTSRTGTLDLGTFRLLLAPAPHVISQVLFRLTFVQPPPPTHKKPTYPKPETLNSELLKKCQ